MEEELESASQATLRDYFAVIVRRKWTIVLSILVIVGLSVFSSVRTTPIYEAHATVLLQPRSSDNIFGNQSGSASVDRDRALQTEILVINSESVRQLVITKTKLPSVPKVHGAVIGRTDAIALKVESTVPGLAAQLANAYADAYIEFRRTQAVNDLTEASKQIALRITQLDQQIAGTKDTTERQALINQQAALNQEVSQLDVSARLSSGGAQLVTAATVPASPFKPTPVRTAILALVLGLMLGIGLAFGREYLDDSIRDRDDLERSLKGSPTLGQIPTVVAWRDKQQPLVVSLTDPASAEAEAYRAFRTSITFVGLERNVRTILFTSGKAGEGKTTTVANLGVALARVGKRVVMIDADLRRPRINEFFDVPPAIGLTSVLVGDHGLGEALVDVGGDIGLSLLPCGPLPPNPSELLSGTRIAELIAALSERYDFVLIDSPPMLPVSDSMALSSRVDAVMLVATARSSTRREMQRCLEILEQVEAPLLGSVFNQIRSEAVYGYGYDSDLSHRSRPTTVTPAFSDDIEYPIAYSAFDLAAEDSSDEPADAEAEYGQPQL